VGPFVVVLDSVSRAVYTFAGSSWYSSALVVGLLLPFIFHDHIHRGRWWDWFVLVVAAFVVRAGGIGGGGARAGGGGVRRSYWWRSSFVLVHWCWRRLSFVLVALVLAVFVVRAGAGVLAAFMQVVFVLLPFVLLWLCWCRWCRCVRTCAFALVCSCQWCWCWQRSRWWCLCWCRSCWWCRADGVRAVPLLSLRLTYRAALVSNQFVCTEYSPITYMARYCSQVSTFSRYREFHQTTKKR
jgi:hypothetical protein